MEILETRLAPAHLQITSGAVGYQVTASDTISAMVQGQTADLVTAQTLSQTTETAQATKGAAIGGIIVGPTSGFVTPLGTNLVAVQASGNTANGPPDPSAHVRMQYTLGTSSNTADPGAGTPMQVQVVADPGDLVGQSATVRLVVRVNGAGFALLPGGSIQTSFNPR